ncbi:MAG TPA: DUF5916 domain-containing protein [Dongiaceae bacterium]|nr:DUF5916 domain-containing protein [Dongiaceae bacterium]
MTCTARWLALPSLWVVLSTALAEPAQVAHIGPDQAPVLDGRLDDAVWQRATPIGELLQVSPQTGQAPSAATDIKIIQDGATLYIAIAAQEPAGYQRTSRQTKRDALLDGDDHVTLVLDPAHGGRNGYQFSVNPNGAQFDALIFDSAEPRQDWDAIWDTRVESDATGWTAELAIPLNSLTTNGGGYWGLNVERYLATTGERLRWRGALPDRDVTALRLVGDLEGVPLQATGHGLRVKPSLRLHQDDRSGELESKLEPGLDVFWRVQPDTTATLTLNSDFAEAEADDRELNLTRYPLFLPEKREFFLQDAGVFSFGGLQANLLPFFSRRIGLAEDGTPLALEAGAKVSHESHELDAGLLAVKVEEGPETEAASVGVGRIAVRTSEHTRLGTIGTVGNPEGASGSSVWGVDWQYRNPQFLPDRELGVDLWTQTSDNTDTGEASAHGAFFNWNNIGWTGNVELTYIDEAFDPALGFVMETGIEQASGEFGYWWHTDNGGNIIPQLDWEWRDGIHDERHYEVLNPEINLENALGNYVMPELFFERETLIEEFEIVPGLVIPAGEYRYDSTILYAGIGSHSMVSGEVSVRLGEFYDGRREDYTLTSDFRPAATWGVTFRGQQTDLHLPSGEETVHLLALGLEVTPTTRIFTNLLTQWDSISDELGVSARLRWTLAPGQDVYVSLNRLFQDEAGSYSTSARDESIKVAWNWIW